MPLSDTILVILGLSTMAMIAASVCRNLPVPYTVFLVIIGMALSTAADYIPALELLDDFRLTPDLVFFIFLPALIFESALNLDARQLIKDIAPILALAIPALIISTAIIGLGTYYMLGIELTVALLFGALIAATDPVAVIALFKELGAPARLTVLVEGESLLNDATATRGVGALRAPLDHVHVRGYPSLSPGVSSLTDTSSGALCAPLAADDGNGLG